MTEKFTKPPGLTDAHLLYLDDLRDSGATNMMAAGNYLDRAFSDTRKQNGEILSYWMNTFSERHRK